MKDRILIIDTNLDLLHSIKRILEINRYDVDTSTTGKESLEKMSQYNYDVVVTDVNLPDINGLELLERIKLSVNSDIPVIMMTGMISIDVVIKSVNLGASDFLKKPFNDYQIHKSITRQIQKRKKDFYYDNYNRYLIGTYYCFEFKAGDYLDFNITDFLVSHLLKLKDLTPSVCNELSLCVEEMLSNAYIHGTYGIGSSCKEMNHNEYNTKIKQLLQEPLIAKKTVSVTVCFRKKAQTVMITVTDQGNGYDFSENTECDEENLFRGLSLIRILSDKVHVFNEGRSIRIEKRIGRKKKKPV